MHFGIFVEEMRRGVSQGQAFQEAFELADTAEAWGVDCVWLGQIHFNPVRSVISASLLVASAIATRTKRLRVGTAIQILPLNHLLRIAGGDARRALTALEAAAGAALDKGEPEVSLTTLEETVVSDLVLHVADASVPEDRLHEMIASVDAVLEDIGACELPIELVLNKVDAVDGLTRRRLANRFPDALQISATTGEGLAELRARIASRFASRFEVVELLVPYEQGGRLAELYALGPPIELREDRPEGVFIRARLPEHELRRFAPFLVAEARRGGATSIVR